MDYTEQLELLEVLHKLRATKSESHFVDLLLKNCNKNGRNSNEKFVSV